VSFFFTKNPKKILVGECNFIFAVNKKERKKEKIWTSCNYFFKKENQKMYCLKFISWLKFGYKARHSESLSIYNLKRKTLISTVRYVIVKS
jgi:hypothetical protein